MNKLSHHALVPASQTPVEWDVVYWGWFSSHKEANACISYILSVSFLNAIEYFTTQKAIAFNLNLSQIPSTGCFSLVPDEEEGGVHLFYLNALKSQ